MWSGRVGEREESVRRPPQGDPSAVCLMVSLSGQPQRLEMKQGIGRMPSRSGNANNGLEHKV